jgi:hypothetical protein
MTLFALRLTNFMRDFRAEGVKLTLSRAKAKEIV